MTIAGSDPSGGAGIQADIKTISALGCFATSAITALVDENTCTVKDIFSVSPQFVKNQIFSIIEDIGADAVKIGMLHSAEMMKAVSESLIENRVQRNIVLDPVMVATSGGKLICDDSLDILKNLLIPQATVITPNIPEGEALLGEKIDYVDQLPDAAKKMSEFGASVLLKGGHLKGDEMLDVFYNKNTNETLILSHKKINTKNTHGTGCTLSSAIASYLALGHDLNEAVRKGKQFITKAIIAGSEYDIGKGNGPVCHLCQ